MLFHVRLCIEDQRMGEGAGAGAVPDRTHQCRQGIERQVVRQIPAKHEVDGIVRRSTRQQRVGHRDELRAGLRCVQTIDAAEMHQVRNFHAATAAAEQSQHCRRRGTEVQDDVPLGIVQPGHQVLKQGRMKRRRRVRPCP